MKRTRWVAPDLERGLDLRPRALRPLPRAGTLLTNLTWFLGQVVLRGRERDRLRALAPHVAPQVLAYPFARLRVWRRLEVARVGRREVRLITDLVALRRHRSGPHALLIYAVRDGRSAPTRLITAFPIDADAFRTLRTLPSGRVSLRPRFNAFVPGFATPRLGRRLPLLRVQTEALRVTPAPPGC